MKTPINLPLLALVTGSLLAFSSPTALAANSTIKIKEKVTVSFDLLPTADAPADAEGSAEIKVEAKNDKVKGKLKLSVTGLADGDYSVDATLEDESTVHIADLSVGATDDDSADDTLAK